MISNLLKFLVNCRKLASIERCNNTPHIKKYNVAEHSFFIALYAMVFADIENFSSSKKSRKEPTNEKQYDLSEVTKKALIHDLEEQITGDILYPMKHNPKLTSYFDTVIESIVDGELFEDLPNGLGDYYKILWKTSKDNSKEGKLVAAMDKFEILLYAKTELDLGNEQLREIFHTAIDILQRDFKEISSLQEVVNDLLEKTHKERTVNNDSQKEVRDEKKKSTKLVLGKNIKLAETI